MATPAADFEQDALVWVACPETVWRPGRVVSCRDGGLTLELAAGDDADAGEGAGAPEILDLPCGSASRGEGPRLLRRNSALVGEGALRFDDLTDVPELHEAVVLHALDARFRRGVIYTLTGPVLLAVNPFRAIPGLYGPDALRRFSGGEVPRPHIFGIAARALRGIRERRESQTVLISGESGAGKTETTKFVMQFLATAGAEAAASAAAAASTSGGTVVAAEGSSSPLRAATSPARGLGGTPQKALSPSAKSPGGGGMSRVERQVLGSNPLLEAFGNAKTLRNDNSSRFGKYIELQFGIEQPGAHASPRLVGARVHTYLLEKVRVVAQVQGERSFHVFYQALAAANAPARLAAAGLGAPRPGEDAEPDLEGFAGRSAASFAYLQGSGCSAPQGDEAEDFEATLSALRAVGISSGEASELFRALAGVLHLGDIRFAPLNSEASEVMDAAPLDLACRLLGVQPAALREALCSRTMQAPGELRAIRMPSSVEKAGESRDALARHLYHTIFSHVVQSTNSSVDSRERALFCGVLDIFGFEFFETNSFEQLCINYTNELLQQYFNTFIFENEAALYQDEGMVWEPQDFPDNSPIVAMLHERVTGILPMLEEECFIMGGTSESWRNKLVRQHEGHENFGVLRQKQAVFVVRHFAGPVTYTVDGFLEKNRDQLSPDLLQCLKSSERLFVRERFLEHDRAFGASWKRPSSTAGEAAPAGSPSAGTGAPRVVRAQRHSVSSEFRQQLLELLGRLRATVPHFVRCIKPNPQSRPFEDPSVPRPRPLLNRRSVAEQLSYQGVLEAIRVARAGYPVRFVHGDFCREFRCLAGRSPRGSSGSGADGAASAPDAAAVRALLESPELKVILAADEGTEDWAIGRTRVFLKQEPCNALRAACAQRRHTAATVLQAAQRCRAASADWARLRRGMLRLQALARGAAARAERCRRRREAAATALEAAARTLLARQRFRLACRAATAAQSWARMQCRRRRFLADRAGLVRVQRWWRSLRKRRRWRHLRRNVLLVQRVWRGSAGRRAALEQRVRWQRLRVAVRSLLRVRQRNRAQRAWRQQAMAKYRGQRSPIPSVPSREALIQELLGLQREYERQEAEVVCLRAEREQSFSRLEALRDRAYLRLRGLFVA